MYNMRKYILHALIISFIFLLAPTAQIASHAGAIEDAKEEVRKNPDDVEAHLNLALAYCNSVKLQDAIESYKQAIRIKPDFAMAHFTLGLAYNSSNDRGSALEQYKILKKLDTELAKEPFNLIYK